MGLGTSVVLGLVGLAASAAGIFISGSQQQSMANYNAAVAEQNAKMATDKATYDAKMHNQEVRRILAAQRSLYGASGVSSESGSSLLVTDDTVKQGAMDALAIRYGGDVKAAKQRSAANLYRMQGKAAMTSAGIGAGTTLLTGASKLV